MAEKKAVAKPVQTKPASKSAAAVKVVKSAPKKIIKEALPSRTVVLK